MTLEHRSRVKPSPTRISLGIERVRVVVEGVVGLRWRWTTAVDPPLLELRRDAAGRGEHTAADATDEQVPVVLVELQEALGQLGARRCEQPARRTTATQFAHARFTAER